MRLLLDLGNTRLKWWAVAEGRLLGEGALAWTDATADGLDVAWAALPAPQAVYGASVVDAAREAVVVDGVRKRGADAVRWLRSPAEACGVRSAYAEPSRLGVDRFLGMVAAHAAGRSPCVLVGVGTALTLDALRGDGQHLGGLIAPGPMLMQQSLLGATARVRPERPGQVVALADNTADAVASGCWGACAALVERFSASAAARLGVEPVVLFGGGDAAPLRSLVERPGALFADGVLRGLAVWSGTGLPPRNAD
ncbi:MAG: type III pantothenate kinase [Xanthomonadaceae bacterium]|nr:type III pantothenate kinase [Xanthomonadaceae bacterium]MDE1965610.1 type III pantothenate kinase [Xanthomonadaceae bacterium]